MVKKQKMFFVGFSQDGTRFGRIVPNKAMARNEEANFKRLKKKRVSTTQYFDPKKLNVVIPKGSNTLWEKVPKGKKSFFERY